MGSKAVFGVLLIGLGILGAYLAITGQLATVWTGLTTGQWTQPGGSSSAAPTGTSAPSTNASTPAPTLTTSPAVLPSTTAAQVQQAEADIQAIENYLPASYPSSATTTPSAVISSLPSVYSTTLAQQSGVTGVVS